MTDTMKPFSIIVVRRISNNELHPDGIKQRKPTISDLIEVYWLLDEKFYAAKVIGYNPKSHKHAVIYEEDGVEESFNLQNRHWRFVDSTVKSIHTYITENCTEIGTLLPKGSPLFHSIIDFSSQQHIATHSQHGESQIVLTVAGKKQK